MLEFYRTDCSLGISMLNKVEIQFFKYGIKFFINRKEVS